jgi:curved DNA-binding protein CbpA
MLQEYYSLLDLNPGATADEIKKAYRLKAKRYHPDTNPSPEAHFQFIRIKEAFDILLKVNNLEIFRKYRTHRFYHPQDPYFQSSHRHNTTGKNFHAKHDHGKRDDVNDFLDSKIGRILYMAVHILFIIIGLMIFTGPLYTIMTRGFDRYTSLFDSLFTTVAAMTFGVIMMIKITLSVVRFIKSGL